MYSCSVVLRRQVPCDYALHSFFPSSQSSLNPGRRGYGIDVLFRTENSTVPHSLYLVNCFHWRLHILSHRTWKNQAGIHLQASFLLTCFHSFGRCYAHKHRRKVIISLIQLWTLSTATASSLARHAHWWSSGTNNWKNKPLSVCFKFSSMRWNP